MRWSLGVQSPGRRADSWQRVDMGIVAALHNEMMGWRMTPAGFLPDGRAFIENVGDAGLFEQRLRRFEVADELAMR